MRTFEAGVDLLDEPLEAAPKNFAVAKLAKQAVALEIGGQFAERGEKPDVSALGGRSHARPLKHFDDARRCRLRPAAAPRSANSRWDWPPEHGPPSRPAARRSSVLPDDSTASSKCVCRWASAQFSASGSESR